MQYHVEGTFLARIRGTKKVSVKRTVEADDEQEAIDRAIEDEIHLGIYNWVDFLDIEVDENENMKATKQTDLPLDAQMRALGSAVAPTLF